jgi:hypothetical protein
MFCEFQRRFFLTDRISLNALNQFFDDDEVFWHFRQRRLFNFRLFGYFLDNLVALNIRAWC